MTGNARDLKSVTVSWVPHREWHEDSDKWNLDVLKLGHRDTSGNWRTTFVRHGSPLYRFRDDRLSWTYNFGSSGCD